MVDEKTFQDHLEREYKSRLLERIPDLETCNMEEIQEFQDKCLHKRRIGRGFYVAIITLGILGALLIYFGFIDTTIDFNTLQIILITLLLLSIFSVGLIIVFYSNIRQTDEFIKRKWRIRQEHLRRE